MKEFGARNFAEILVFIVLMNALVFIGVAVLHEVGHGLLGVMYGCENIAITIYDFSTGATQTLMNCAEVPPGPYMYLSSYMLVAPVSILLLALRDFKEAYMGFIMFGGNLLASLSDLAILSSSQVLAVLSVVAGVGFILLGEHQMIRKTVEERTPSLLEQFEESERTREEKEGSGKEGEDGGREEAEGEKGKSAWDEEGFRDNDGTDTTPTDD